MLPFSFAAIRASLKTMGAIDICARTNDAAWVRPEMRTIGWRSQWPLMAQLESLMPSLRIFSHSVLRVMPSASALWAMCPS